MLTMHNVWDLQHTKTVNPAYKNDAQNALSLRQDEQENEGSLGQFMERSMSAPPLNDTNDGFSGFHGKLTSNYNEQVSLY